MGPETNAPQSESRAALCLAGPTVRGGALLEEPAHEPQGPLLLVPGGVVNVRNHARLGCCHLVLRWVDTIIPWALAVLVGVLTASTGIYITINCDFLSDLRFGSCNDLSLCDRSRCCGGADNIDHATERCKGPPLIDSTGLSTKAVVRNTVEWVPWDERLPWQLACYLATSVGFSGVAAFLVHRFASSAKGSGIPDAKAAVSGFCVSASFSTVCLLVKVIGLCLVVGAGLSLGKEGPLIQIGVCWAYLVRHSGGTLGTLTGTVPLQEVVCIGAAAGVSTAFGAPVGGVLFAVEELGAVHALSQRALLLAFAGSFTASFVLKSWNLYGSNQLTVFALSTSTNHPSKEWRTWEISIFFLLGIVGGLVGSLFIWLNLWVTRQRRAEAEAGRIWLVPSAVHEAALRWLPSCMLRPAHVSDGFLSPSMHVNKPAGLTPCAVHVLEVMMIALITASLNYPFTRLLRLPMVEVIHGLFETCPHSLGRNLGLCNDSFHHGFATGSRSELALLLAAVARFAQTVMTFGAMIPSGLFIPSLYIGAVLGRFVGLLTLDTTLHLFGQNMQAQVNPSVFAMVGAVAMLSGFARMTVSLVVIMLELTGELNLAVPFMCAVLSAKLVGDSLTVSIYDGHAALLGFATIEDPKDLCFATQVSDVAVLCKDDDIIDVSCPISVEALRSTLRAGPASGRSCGDAECAGTAQTPARPSMVPSLPLPRHGREDCSPARTGELDVLVLVRDRQRGQVCGVVGRGPLHRWLETTATGAGALCTFDEAACTALDSSLPLVDASGLVEHSFQRLLGTAPLLTAVCAFRDCPELQHCICRGELEGGSLWVLSRRHLEEALTARSFAVAFRRRGTSAWAPAGTAREVHFR